MNMEVHVNAAACDLLFKLRGALLWKWIACGVAIALECRKPCLPLGVQCSPQAAGQHGIDLPHDGADTLQVPGCQASLTALLQDEEDIIDHGTGQGIVGPAVNFDALLHALLYVKLLLQEHN